MSTVLEYPTYDRADDCLTDREALERYRIEKANNPGAVVELNDLSCGEHWNVKVYTKAESERVIRERIRELVEEFKKAAQEALQK
ncbi:MAG: hypothetical protein QOE96_3965 [Blastocatellia bacterium]|jgi:hypothetical protein|nr:hypothetical protein [Blastocatellia bacterium]